MPRINASSRFKAARASFLLAALIVALGVSACGGKIPPTHYYKLNIPPAPVATQGDGDNTAILMPFGGSKLLTQDKIVYRPNPEEVGFYEYHRWAEDPRTTVAQSLLDHLRGNKTFDRIVMFDGRTTADYIVRGRIDRLEEIDGPGGTDVKVALRISAEVLSVEEREPLWVGSHEETLQVTTRDVRTVVSTMSDAAAKSVAKLARDINGFVSTHKLSDAPDRDSAGN